MKYTKEQIQYLERNFKTIQEIASMCNTDYDHIASIIAKEKINPVHSNPYRLSEDQQMIIFMVMHYENRTNYLVFPSKINGKIDAPEVYTKKLAIERNHITPKGNF